MSRMILYGRLEDEKPFSTVRRLVEYEDHMLRLLRDAGLPTPRPYGLVEITPEREYVIVMEFIEDAREVGAEPIGEREIDDAPRHRSPAVAGRRGAPRHQAVEPARARRRTGAC